MCESLILLFLLCFTLLQKQKRHRFNSASMFPKLISTKILIPDFENNFEAVGLMDQRFHSHSEEHEQSLFGTEPAISTIKPWIMMDLKLFTVVSKPCVAICCATAGAKLEPTELLIVASWFNKDVVFFFVVVFLLKCSCYPSSLLVIPVDGRISLCRAPINSLLSLVWYL